MDAKLAIQVLVLELRKKEDELSRKKMYFQAMVNRDISKSSFPKLAKAELDEMENLSRQIDAIMYSIELLQK